MYCVLVVFIYENIRNKSFGFLFFFYAYSYTSLGALWTISIKYLQLSQNQYIINQLKRNEI